MRSGRVKVWIHRTGDPVEVERGKELCEGRSTLEEIRERREHEQLLAHATPGSEGRAWNAAAGPGNKDGAGRGGRVPERPLGTATAMNIDMRA